MSCPPYLPATVARYAAKLNQIFVSLVDFFEFWKNYFVDTSFPLLRLAAQHSSPSNKCWSAIQHKNSIKSHCPKFARRIFSKRKEKREKRTCLIRFRRLHKFLGTMEACLSVSFLVIHSIYCFSHKVSLAIERIIYVFIAFCARCVQQTFLKFNIHFAFNRIVLSRFSGRNQHSACGRALRRIAFTMKIIIRLLFRSRFERSQQWHSINL